MDPEVLAEALAALDEVGWAVLPGFIAAEEARVLRRRSEEIPIFKHLSDFGGDSGLFVCHAHNLLGKTRAFDALCANPGLLELVRGHLQLAAEELPLLNIAALLDTVPGQRGQRLHRDDGSWPVYDSWPHRPLVANCVIALDPFDAENGATRLVSKSHRLSDPINPSAVCHIATLSPGDLLVWTGALWHAGGGNTSASRSRRAINFNYIQPYLRQEEDQTLGVAHNDVVKMPHTLQQMLGYSARGWTVDFRQPLEILAENSRGNSIYGDADGCSGRGHPGVATSLTHSKSPRFLGIAYPARL
eukprot:SAG31_NODE_8_length_42345_cov_10.980992_10_plen_302_part_00